MRDIHEWCSLVSALHNFLYAIHCIVRDRHLVRRKDILTMSRTINLNRVLGCRFLVGFSFGNVSYCNFNKWGSSSFLTCFL
jgi:hypothetical protein